MRIYAASPCETVLYAAEELKKYLEMMDSSVHAEITEGEGADGIILSVGLYDGVDPMMDDVIDAEIDCLKGCITGSNGRSVLMGVYNFLKSAGCLWVRPGKKGEFIPEKAMGAHAFSMHKKADFPFRGDCIEGAVSLENVLETVEWLPKVNMNAFMLQFVVAHQFLSCWYYHYLSRHKEKEVFTEEMGEEMTAQIEKQIKKCGLQLHSLGHGYMFEPYGVRYLGPIEEYGPGEEAYPDMAQTGGKRQLHRKRPVLTQLCMSNPEVRRKMVNYLVSYIQGKPYVDFLHVWLADGNNNHCECEECVKARPSDFYVMMLNELDAELTARGIDTRIIFCMYTDTNWPPQAERFKNPARFILDVAVPGRDYRIPYNGDRYQGVLPEYKRNDNHVKVDFTLTQSFFDEWKKSGFSGRTQLFDYYLYYYHYMDPGYMHMAGKMYADAQGMAASGFDGAMQCRTQRSYFPTALPMAIQGEALFDAGTRYEEYAEKFFSASFGAEWEEALNYLNGVSDIFQPDELAKCEEIFAANDFHLDAMEKCEEEIFIKSAAKAAESKWVRETADRLSGIYGHLEKYRPVIERNQRKGDSCRDESWRILSLHAEYCRLLADTYIAMLTQGREEGHRVYEKLWYWLSAVEDELQPYLDMLVCSRRIAQIMKYSFKK